MNPPSGTVFRTSRNTVSPSRSRTKPTSSSSPSTTGFPQFLPLRVQVKCTIYQLRQSPPLAPAIALSVPLSILWRQGNRFYGSFSAWMGYKAEIEAVHTTTGVQGRLFLFSQFALFAVPNVYRRSNEFVVVLRLLTDLLSIEPSSLEPSRVLGLALPIDTPSGIRTEHFLVMWAMRRGDNAQIREFLG